MCKAMQAHCEPFYGAVRNWLKYEDRRIMKNRIQMLLCASSLYKSYGSNKVDDTYAYDIISENTEYELLPEIIPVAGKQYVEGGDAQSYAKLKAETSQMLFIKVGIYFQTHVLKALAGWNAEILLSSNLETRASITRCLEMLYRIPEKAGKLHFTAQRVKSFTGYVETQPTVVDLVEVTGDHLAFYEFLVSYQNQITREIESATKSIAPHPSGKVKFTKDGRAWVVDNEFVGVSIARYFPTECDDVVLFTGRVTRYLPESTVGRGNQLYHVIFDEDYEIDINEKAFQEGLKLLQTANVWIDTHESIGWNVAAVFPIQEGNLLVLYSLYYLILYFLKVKKL